MYSEVRFSKIIPLSIFFIVVSACGGGQKDSSFYRSDEASFYIANVNDIETKAENQVERDSSGNITKIKGVDQNEQLASLSEKEVDHSDGLTNYTDNFLEEFKKLNDRRDEPIFEVTDSVDPNIEIKFSEPVMVGASALALTMTLGSCFSSEYSEKIPTIGSLLDTSIQAGRCGNIVFSRCVQFRLKNNLSILKKMQAPTVNLNIPCSDKYFKNLGFISGIVSGESTAEFKIKLNPLVDKMYLTQSDKGCHQGGVWEGVLEKKESKIIWKKESDLQEVATFYLKYRDIFGNESKCFSQEISRHLENSGGKAEVGDETSQQDNSQVPVNSTQVDDTAPSSTTISISSGGSLHHIFFRNPWAFSKWCI